VRSSAGVSPAAPSALRPAVAAARFLPRPGSGPRKLGKLQIATLALGGIALGLYFHTVQVENQANAKQMQIITLKEGNDHLTAALAELKTLPSVEVKATAMGMAPVERYHYVSMDAEAFEKPGTSYKVIIPVTRNTTPSPLGF
jgi:hypothetical protein